MVAAAFGLQALLAARAGAAEPPPAVSRPTNLPGAVPAKPPPGSRVLQVQSPDLPAGVVPGTCVHFDPTAADRHRTVYVDPGHLAINGEPLDMGIRMPGDKLCMVGLKDFMRRQTPPYSSDWVPMGEGVVDWKLVAKTLKDVKYKGWMSIFCEWNASDTKDAIRLAKQDTDYFRKISGG